MRSSFHVSSDNLNAFMGAAQNIDPALFDGSKLRHKDRRNEKLRRKHARLNSDM